jgi:hypothetical protein
LLSTLTNNYSRLSELEKEVRNLRESVQNAKNSNEHVMSPRTTDAASSTDDNFNAIQNISSLEVLDIEGTISRYHSLLEAQRLEDIDINSREIVEHVIIFYQHYHEHFPILGSFQYQLENLQSSPLLLWAIVAISSRMMASRSHLWLQLVGPMTRLAGLSIMGSEKPSLFLVQALLLLCEWPLSFTSTIEDPSWTYCGAALSIAERIGLHQPANFFETIYGSKSDEDVVTLRRKSWVS